jgi:hypothetical protein
MLTHLRDITLGGDTIYFLIHNSQLSQIPIKETIYC